MRSTWEKEGFGHNLKKSVWTAIEAIIFEPRQLELGREHIYFNENIPNIPVS